MESSSLAIGVGEIAPTGGVAPGVGKVRIGGAATFSFRTLVLKF